MFWPGTTARPRPRTQIKVLAPLAPVALVRAKYTLHVNSAIPTAGATQAGKLALKPKTNFVLISRLCLNLVLLLIQSYTYYITILALPNRDRNRPETIHAKKSETSEKAQEIQGQGHRQDHDQAVLHGTYYVVTDNDRHYFLA